MFPFTTLMATDVSTFGCALVGREAADRASLPA